MRASDGTVEGLVGAVGTGSRLLALQAVRDSLAVDIAGCESLRDKASLGRLLVDVLEQIESVEKRQPASKGTGLDEFTARRKANGSAGADGRARAAGGVQRG